MTRDEIRAAIVARPELADMVTARDDAGIAAALSAGRTRLRRTQIGPGTILAALGPTGGAQLLDTLTAMAADPQYSAVKWALKVIDRGEFDLGVAAARAQVATLAAGGVMTAQTRDALLALGEEPDPVSVADVSDALNGV